MLKVLFSIYAFLVFTLLMLAIFPFIVVSSFFGKIKGGNAIYKICNFWADSWFLFSGIRSSVINKIESPQTTHYIYVSNHISYLDIPMILQCTRKTKVRILGKAEMAKIPIFGFIYKCAVVMVQRTNMEQRMKSVETLKSVLQKNISVFICPEGTFNTTHQPLKFFYDGAFKIAIETQTPIKPVLFLDTYDRLNYKSIFSLTPGKCRAFFLNDIDTTGFTIDDVEILKQKVFSIMEQELINYKASWIKK